MGVFCQDVSRQIVVLVLAVEQQQVAESFRRKGVLLQQELELLEPIRRLRVHVHQGLIISFCHYEIEYVPASLPP